MGRIEFGDDCRSRDDVSFAVPHFGLGPCVCAFFLPVLLCTQSFDELFDRSPFVDACSFGMVKPSGLVHGVQINLCRHFRPLELECLSDPSNDTSTYTLQCLVYFIHVSAPGSAHEDTIRTHLDCMSHLEINRLPW